MSEYSWIARTSQHMRTRLTILQHIPPSLLSIVGLQAFSLMAWAQIGLVQVASCGPQTFPASTCTIQSTGTGNVLVVAWTSQNGGGGTTIASVTDNAGNVYSEAGSARATDTAANTMADIWYAGNSVAGATVVTITPSPSGTSGTAVIWEFSGAEPFSPLDQTAVLNSQAGATTTPMLTGVLSTPSGTQTLTSLGTSDWADWGLTSANSFNHKATGGGQISNYTAVGTGSASQYSTNPFGFTWTDGTPTTSATNSSTGLYVSGQGNGFQITAPADTTQRTLSVYVGVWSAQGQIVAHLSDGSAADYVDTSLNNPSATTPGLYTFTYRAGSSGQTLTVTFTQVNNTIGNVTLQAATLETTAVAGASVTGATVATTSPAEVIISIANAQGTVVGISSGNSFTIDSTASGEGWAHLITSSAGTYAPTWTTNTTGTYCSSTVSFKAASTGGGACDLNQDGIVNVVDVQLATNMDLAIVPCPPALDGGVCGTTLVQQIVSAALGQGCSAAVDHSVALTWTASASANIAGYNVYRSTTSGSGYTQINSSLVSSTSYTDTTVATGQTYYYVTTAVDNNNNQSGYSNQAQATVPTDI